MHILLTNDDSIYAEGIYALYLELKKIGKVTVVAPDSEKSSVGHGITLAHPIWDKKVNRKGRFFGVGVSGTPADCVKFATGVLLARKPDFVVSGINLGHNDGCSIFYSGTVAGAREGALMGIPSMAISLATFVNPDFKYAAQCGARLTKLAIKNGMPKGTFLNVNVPNKKRSQIKGIKMTRQGLVPIHGTFSKRKDPNFREYHWMTGKIPNRSKNNGIDTAALNNNFVTVTPVQSDQTDYAFLEQLGHWKI
jgi:5'-nucleotidase